MTSLKDTECLLEFRLFQENFARQFQKFYVGGLQINGWLQNVERSSPGLRKVVPASQWSELPDCVSDLYSKLPEQFDVLPVFFEEEVTGKRTCLQC